MAAGTIRIGVAGWDYPDWAGAVYPTGRGVDRLAYLARYVDLIEINSTFYRPNAPRHAEAWVRRTRDLPDFRFAAKTHRSWTHERDTDLADVVPPTLLGLAPLRDAGVLSAVLVQFPQSFHRTDEALDRLDEILDRLAGWPAVIEVRHRSWDDDEAAERLRRRGAGWCVVDQPAVGGSTAPPRPRVTGNVAYLRLHGRNVRDWFRSGAGRDARYDYLYSMDEVRSLAATASTLAHDAAEVLVVQNNHFRGQALVNALQMKHVLGNARPAAPEPLASTYPEIATFAAVHRERLF